MFKCSKGGEELMEITSMHILQMGWPFNPLEITLADANYSGLKYKCTVVWGIEILYIPGLMHTFVEIKRTQSK